MSSASRAVFLSYASQDAEAARKICEALRPAGVEVWFDQSELRGGDAWDQKIRRQIKECALFIPIVSANTQARREGYFRLEWKLADERTHLMARGTPFLLPVCIDDTKDWDAIVPESFTIVQWMRLQGGETTPAFCERVQGLLTQEQPSERGRAGRGRDEGAASPTQRRGRLSWLVAALAGIAIAAGVAIWQPWKRPRRSPRRLCPRHGGSR